MEDRLVEARESMRFQATHDLLTSLWNRGVIVELLSREVHRLAGRTSCTAVMLCDIDHFKLVNDQHGHSAGDDVLREVARRLQHSVRSYDMVGRYGGEEFLVILNKCDEASARRARKTSANAISAKPFQTRCSIPAVTISIGVALSTDFASRGVDDIIQEADRALYAAKAAGRNCVRLARPCLGSRSAIFRGASCRFVPRSAKKSTRKIPPRLHLVFPRLCSIICRIATVEPGARFSRQASRRLQVSSMPEKRKGFLNAARQVGTIERMRSHTTQISPLLSKKSSSLIRPRLTMLATISQ